MTWTYDSANDLDQASWPERFDALLTLLNGRGDPTTSKGGWRVGTGGIGANARVIVFEFKDAVTNTQRYSQGYLSDVTSTSSSAGCNISLEVNADYDPAASIDTANGRPFLTDRTYGRNARPNTTVDVPWKVWFNDQNPEAFLVMNRKLVLSCFLPVVARQAAVFSEVPYYDQTNNADRVQYGVAAPSWAQSSYVTAVQGFPNYTTQSNNGPYIVQPNPLYGSYTVPESMAQVWTDLPSFIGGAYLGDYTSDVAFYTGTEDADQASKVSPAGSAYADGRYWIATRTDTGYPSWLLSTGQVDPLPLMGL